MKGGGTCEQRGGDTEPSRLDQGVAVEGVLGGFVRSCARKNTGH